jgi:hypothetical protein
METTKVSEWVEIQAPRSDVFDVVVNVERRTQLSPLYGTILLDDVSPDYPNEGSNFRLKLREQDYEYDSVVTTVESPIKFTYELDVRRKTKVTWLFQDVSRGTRVIYEEEFLIDGEEDDEYVQSVREAIRQWLNNIKFYTELRDGRFKMFIRWVMDRYFLRLRNDQRKVILMILFLQIASCFSFIMAAIMLGIVRLFQ